MKKSPLFNGSLLVFKSDSIFSFLLIYIFWGGGFFSFRFYVGNSKDGDYDPPAVETAVGAEKDKFIDLRDIYPAPAKFPLLNGPFIVFRCRVVTFRSFLA